VSDADSSLIAFSRKGSAVAEPRNAHETLRALSYARPCITDEQLSKDAYKLLFENERVRVFEVRFKPGERIAMHSHPDHVVYVLDNGKLKLSYPDGKSVEVVLQAGQTLWIPAETHAAEEI
jgi:beta-alanine degradation protein BauB